LDDGLDPRVEVARAVTAARERRREREGEVGRDTRETKGGIPRTRYKFLEYPSRKKEVRI
jgi:hypothetical protein